MKSLSGGAVCVGNIINPNWKCKACNYETPSEVEIIFLKSVPVCDAIQVPRIAGHAGVP